VLLALALVQALPLLLLLAPLFLLVPWRALQLELPRRLTHLLLVPLLAPHLLCLHQHPPWPAASTAKTLI
jgi:hypothetical protein